LQADYPGRQTCCRYTRKHKEAWGRAPGLSCATPFFGSRGSNPAAVRREISRYAFLIESKERDTWLLIGSAVSAAILLESALISFA